MDLQSEPGEGDRDKKRFYRTGHKTSTGNFTNLTGKSSYFLHTLLCIVLFFPNVKIFVLNILSFILTKPETKDGVLNNVNFFSVTFNPGALSEICKLILKNKAFTVAFSPSNNFALLK